MRQNVATRIPARKVFSMRSAMIGIAAAVAVSAAATGTMAQKPELKGRAVAPKAAAKPLPNEHDQDEKAIRQIAEAFTKAYNAHDAKTVAQLFTADAESTDDEGNTTS